MSSTHDSSNLHLNSIWESLNWYLCHNIRNLAMCNNDNDNNSNSNINNNTNNLQEKSHSFFYNAIETHINYWQIKQRLNFMKHNNESIQHIIELLNIHSWHPQITFRYNVIKV